jgi:glutamine cyclotransferase
MPITIAEWAEDYDTVETLAEIGVDYVQGWALSRPVTPQRILSARSGADFITDERIRVYLDTRPVDDELAEVDWVLGQPTVPPSPASSSMSG